MVGSHDASHVLYFQYKDVTCDRQIAHPKKCESGPRPSSSLISALQRALSCSSICYHLLYCTSTVPQSFTQFCSSFSDFSEKHEQERGKRRKGQSPCLGPPFTIPSLSSPGGGGILAVLAMEGERESLFSAHLTLFRPINRLDAPQQCDCGAGKAQGLRLQATGWKSARPSRR